VVTFPTSTKLAISVPPGVVPTEIKYPVAFNDGFQVILESTGTSVADIVGNNKVVQSGKTVEALVVKLSEGQTKAEPV